MTEDGCCLLNNATVFSALILEMCSGFPRIQNNLRHTEHETFEKKKQCIKPDMLSPCQYDTHFTTLDLTSNLFFFKIQNEIEREPSGIICAKGLCPPQVHI